MAPLSRSSSTSSTSTNYLSPVTTSITSKLSLGISIDITKICYGEMTQLYDLLTTQYFQPYYQQYVAACFTPDDIVRFNAIKVGISYFDRRPALDHRAAWHFLNVATNCEMWTAEVLLAAMVGQRVFCENKEISAHAEREIEFLIRLQSRFSGAYEVGVGTCSEGGSSWI
jgi:hypothetical protein